MRKVTVSAVAGLTLGIGAVAHVEVAVVEALDTTARGECGFGSTG